MVDAADTRPPGEWDGDGADGPLARFTAALLLPTVEEEALRTRRAGATEIAVAVGLDDELLRVCAGAVGDLVRIVATNECAAARDLFAILRPRLVVITASLADSDGDGITAEATSRGAQVVWVGPGASAVLIDWLVRRAASLAFGMSHRLGDPGDRATASTSESGRHAAR